MHGTLSRLYRQPPNLYYQGMVGRGFPKSFIQELPVRPGSNELEPVTFTQFIARREIVARIGSLASAVARDYRQLRGRERPLFVTILNGAAPFSLELAAQVTKLDPTIEPQVDTVQCKSYSGTTSGQLRMQKGHSVDPQGRHVVLIDDIIHGGRTLKALSRYYQSLGAKSLRIAALLEREDGTRYLSSSPVTPPDTIWHISQVPLAQEPVVPRYIGFTLSPDTGFVAGYGMDINELYRSWPHIYAPGNLGRGYSMPELPESAIYDMS